VPALDGDTGRDLARILGIVADLVIVVPGFAIGLTGAWLGSRAAQAGTHRPAVGRVA